MTRGSSSVLEMVLPRANPATKPAYRTYGAQKQQSSQQATPLAGSVWGWFVAAMRACQRITVKYFSSSNCPRLRPRPASMPAHNTRLGCDNMPRHMPPTPMVACGCGVVINVVFRCLSFFVFGFAVRALTHSSMLARSLACSLACSKNNVNRLSSVRWIRVRRRCLHREYRWKIISAAFALAAFNPAPSFYRHATIARSLSPFEAPITVLGTI